MTIPQDRPIRIVVESRVAAPVARVWEYWVNPEQIVRWNAASDDWHTTSANNDLRVGGSFLSRMEAKDGSFAFDFSGTYTEIEPHSRIAYRLGEGAEARNVRIEFESADGATVVRQTFDAESTHPHEMQRSGWQSILDRFRELVESEAG